MVPTSKVEVPALAVTFKRLANERVEQVILTELTLPALKPARVVLAQGWSDGGHSQPRPMLFALDAGVTHVLEPLVQNVDADGYHRRVTGLLRCSVEGALERKKMTLLGNLDGWDRVRDETCKPLALKGSPQELAALLATALDGYVPQTTLSTPALVALLDGKKPPHTKWTLPEMKRESWSADAKKGRGMCQGGDGGNELLYLSIELNAGQVLFEQKSLAFEQRFIE